MLNGVAYPVKRITFIGDSECAISAAESEDGVLKPWLSNWVGEISKQREAWSRGGIIVDPLYHTPGPLNVADLATRGTATPKDVAKGLLWQCGHEYLTKERE